jgi:hypothetical protein
VTATAIDRSDVVRLVRVYADEAGESHLEEIEMGANLGEVPVRRVEILNYGRRAADWHTAPTRRFALNIVGELEVKTSDGGTHRLGPNDLVFLEDTTGKGHVTLPLTPITVIFIHVEDGFDVLSWAQNTGD